MVKKEVQTNMEKTRLSDTEIVQKIREQLKTEFPKCKFAIRQHQYAGGWSINIALMKANFQVVKKFEDMNPDVLAVWELRNYPAQQIQENQAKTYHQLSQWFDPYNEKDWCNGVFLTQEGHALFKRVVDITRQYNWDNSDHQGDYFDVKFYLHLSLGQYNKPYQQVVG